MAKINKSVSQDKGYKVSKSRQKRTSIGRCGNKTMPKNKNKRRNWKKYRGQGK